MNNTDSKNSPMYYVFLKASQHEFDMWDFNGKRIEVILTMYSSPLHMCCDIPDFPTHLSHTVTHRHSNVLTNKLQYQNTRYRCMFLYLYMYSWKIEVI